MNVIVVIHFHLFAWQLIISDEAEEMHFLTILFLFCAIIDLVTNLVLFFLIKWRSTV